jgi:ketosteroid isomerase-like protein
VKKTPSTPGTSARWAVGAVLILGMILPAGAGAQIPGGRSLNVDRERATFRATILKQIRPMMDSWQGAWRGDVGPSLESFYAPDAVVAVRDSMMGGSETLGDFAEAARRSVAGLAPSMLDFDASERLAYVYGAWDATSARGGERAAGRVVTILRKTEGEWVIRLQVFSADSAAGDLLKPVTQEEPLPSLERRVAVGSRAVVPTKRGDGERQDARTVQRISVYRDLISTLASLRAAWSRDDAEALTDLMRKDAWVQLPGVADWAGHVTSADLNRILRDFGTLHTAELDFDLGDTLAYLSGRYYAERSSGPSQSGSYVAVFQNLGSGWQVRSLVFF